MMLKRIATGLLASLTCLTCLPLQAQESYSIPDPEVLARDPDQMNALAAAYVRALRLREDIDPRSPLADVDFIAGILDPNTLIQTTSCCDACGSDPDSSMGFSCTGCSAPGTSQVTCSNFKVRCTFNGESCHVYNENNP